MNGLKKSDFSKKTVIKISNLLTMMILLLKLKLPVLLKKKKRLNLMPTLSHQIVIPLWELLLTWLLMLCLKKLNMNNLLKEKNLIEKLLKNLKIERESKKWNRKMNVLKGMQDKLPDNLQFLKIMLVKWKIALKTWFLIKELQHLRKLKSWKNLLTEKRELQMIKSKNLEFKWPNKPWPLPNSEILPNVIPNNLLNKRTPIATGNLILILD